MRASVSVSVSERTSMSVGSRFTTTYVAASFMLVCRPKPLDCRLIATRDTGAAPPPPPTIETEGRRSGPVLIDGRRALMEGRRIELIGPGPRADTEGRRVLSLAALGCPDTDGRRITLRDSCWERGTRNYDAARNGRAWVARERISRDPSRQVEERARRARRFRRCDDLWLLIPDSSPCLDPGSCNRART